MHRRPGPSLSLAQLTAARVAYDAGATFQAIANQLGLAEVTMRRMLVAAGCVPRPRGAQARELPVDLILADHDSGMSARTIAQKHGVGCHRDVTAILRAHGRTPHHRGRSKGNRGVVLGMLATNAQWRCRQRPPLTIPIRTPLEMVGNTWTAAELEAVAYEIRAGRFRIAPRGRSGLPEAHGLREQILASFRQWNARAA